MPLKEETSEDYPLAFEDLNSRCANLTDKILGILSYDSMSCPQEIRSKRIQSRVCRTVALFRKQRSLISRGIVFMEINLFAS
jgi:hypothetical protein